jgi:tetratricopeptide (TPR) repeat protein
MVWLIPAVTAVLIAAFVLILYSGAKSKDNKVEDLKLRAENAALEGNLDDASKLIAEALALNPDYPELKDDESILKKGDKISDALKKVDELIKQKNYKEALASLSKTDEEIKKDNEVFKKVFSKIVENKKAFINVMQLKDNASSMKSIEQLCPVYKSAAAINTPEALKVSEELKTKIEELAAANAKTALKSKDYDAELEELNLALRYVTGSKTLTDLKNDIQKKKNDYEANLKKISSGILSKEKEISEEDITATISQPLLDTNGQISGKVVNNGAQNYYNVRVLLKIYDETGNITDQLTVTCTPSELPSKGSISFTYKYNNSSKVFVRPVGLVYIQEEDTSYDEEGDANNEDVQGYEGDGDIENQDY